jgi:chorismate mutase
MISTQFTFQSSRPNGVHRPSCLGRTLVILLIGCVGCTPVAQPNPPVVPTVTSTNPADSSNSAVTKLSDRQRHLTGLLSRVRDRLDLMEGVAQSKWVRKSPITDAKREATLLDGLQARGTERGLPTDFVRGFFEAQITASKLIQQHYFDDWSARPEAPTFQPPDLEKEVRPKIDKLNEQLLEGLAQYWAERSGDGLKADLDRIANEVFNVPQWSAQKWQTDAVNTALQPLRGFKDAGDSKP